MPWVEKGPQVNITESVLRTAAMSKAVVRETGEQGHVQDQADGVGLGSDVGALSIKTFAASGF